MWTAQERAAFEDRRRVARDVLAPIAASGRPGRVNRYLLRALGTHGLLRQLLPRAGSVRCVELCLLREAVARESAEGDTAMVMQGLGGFPILAGGRPELVDRWIPAIVRGGAVAAFAMTEPEHGSDATGLQLRAERAEGGYRLTGEKTWISNAPDADVYAVFVRTTAGSDAKGITAFAVAGDTPGLSGEPIELISDHPIGRLTFDGVFVPDECVLGGVDEGWRLASATFARFRPSVGAAAVGMAGAALEAAVEHAKTREQFGKPLAGFQAISHLIAEMATRLEAARALVYEAARETDQGGGRRELSSMAKLFATETAQWVVDAAVQVHGARGLERGHLLERLYREVRSLRIYEGTSEIQREIIARELTR